MENDVSLVFSGVRAFTVPNACESVIMADGASFKEDRVEARVSGVQHTM